MVDGAGGFDEFFGPGYRLVVFDPEAEEPRVGGDGGGHVEVAVVGGPPERGAQIGQLGGEPVVGLALAGAVPQGQDVGFAPGEVAGMGGPDLGRPRRWRRVAPRRTGGSSPASKTGSAPMTGRRPAATCAPARPADPGRRSRRRHRIRPPRRRFGGRIRRRTPNTVPAATFPHRRAGRRTMPPRGAASGGAPGRAVTRPAAGTADRDDHGPRPPSSTPSARPPTRSPTGSRRGDGRSPPPRPPHRRGQREARRHALGAFDEQIHCGRVDSRADIQRGHRPQLLVGDPQPFAAGGQNLHRRRLREDRPRPDPRRRRRTCSQLSNTNSRDPALQRGGHRLAHGLARLLGDAQHRRHRVGHRRRISDRSQFENPDPVGKFIGQPRRDFGRQAGLANPAHPGQRHQPMSIAPPLAPRRVRTHAR